MRGLVKSHCLRTMSGNQREGATQHFVPKDSTTCTCWWVASDNRARYGANDQFRSCESGTRQQRALPHLPEQDAYVGAKAYQTQRGIMYDPKQAGCDAQYRSGPDTGFEITSSWRCCDVRCAGCGCCGSCCCCCACHCCGCECCGCACAFGGVS